MIIGTNVSQKLSFYDWLKITFLLAGDSYILDIEDSLPYHRNTISKVVQEHKSNNQIFESHFRPTVRFQWKPIKLTIYVVL